MGASADDFLTALDAINERRSVEEAASAWNWLTGLGTRQRTALLSECVAPPAPLPREVFWFFLKLGHYLPDELAFLLRHHAPDAALWLIVAAQYGSRLVNVNGKLVSPFSRFNDDDLIELLAPGTRHLDAYVAARARVNAGELKALVGSFCDLPSANLVNMMIRVASALPVGGAQDVLLNGTVSVAASLATRWLRIRTLTHTSKH